MVSPFPVTRLELLNSERSVRTMGSDTIEPENDAAVQLFVPRILIEIKYDAPVALFASYALVNKVGTSHPSYLYTTICWICCQRRVFSTEIKPVLCRDLATSFPPASRLPDLRAVGVPGQELHIRKVR